MRQQRRAGQVARGEHAVDCRAQRVVGEHEAGAVELHAGLLVAQPAAQRAAAHAHQHARGAHLLAAGEGQQHVALAAARHLLDGGADAHLDARLAKGLL